jgi:NAD(P)-dependent dehydrogenase (short-subunit alcohol dehydrogenase family)
MRRSGGGSVINMASILGQVGFAMSSAYVAAKHAVVGMTKAAAWEHAADGVRVNAVGPGFIITPLWKRTLISRRWTFGQPACAATAWPTRRVAELVAWLASDASSFVTGAYYPWTAGTWLADHGIGIRFGGRAARCDRFSGRRHSRLMFDIALFAGSL